MKRERREPEADGCPLWVVTFGDAMSLLVTFFVMLVSFADFEEHSLQQMFGALKGGLRASPLPMAVAVGAMPIDKMSDEDIDSTEEADPSITTGTEKMVGSSSADRVVRTTSADYYLHLLANGVSLVINRRAVFEPGTATLVSSSHEVWGVARDMMRLVNNEVSVFVTLPENVVVRLDDYKTSWGLGIEQALTIQKLLSEFNGPRGHGQISTSVRVVKSMPKNTPSEGMVEVFFVGFNEQLMKSMPDKILKESWREVPEPKGESYDG
jgi:chemotaxis protein MotB